MCESISVSLAVTRGKFEDAQLLRFSDEVFSCALNLGNFAAIVVQVLRGSRGGLLTRFHKNIFTRVAIFSSIETNPVDNVLP